MLVIFIKNIFSIATKNYNSMSKLLQNLIKFSAILMEKIEKISTAKKEFYPILVLSFFNAILTAIIEQNETNFIENFIEIKTKGLNLVILMINQTKFQDRFFNNIKNIFIYNYFILLSNDNAIVSDVLFKETVGSFLTNVFDLCDQCNIDSYNIFFKFLEKLYIPYILNKINDTKSNESILEIMKFINVCRDNLVGNCRWTFRYKEVNNLMSFILNEKFFFNDNLIKSKIFNKFIIETWEIGSKYWLIQRSVIDHLFKIFYYYPQIMNNFEDVFVYLLKSKENRGYDANLLFYLDEFYIPVYIFSLNFFHINI